MSQAAITLLSTREIVGTVPRGCGGDQILLNLVPVVSWIIWGTQNAHRDSIGFWLDDMVHLEPAEKMDHETEEFLERKLYGEKDSAQGGIFVRNEGKKEELRILMLKFLNNIGFKGDPEPYVCTTGLFFSQLELNGRDSVEIYAASGIRWTFGSPGLARWKENGVFMYCAGAFTGIVKTELSESLLLE